MRESTLADFVVAAEAPPAPDGTLAALLAKRADVGEGDSLAGLVTTGATLSSLVAATGGTEDPRESVVVIGGVEHHVGGWADFEFERREHSRYGVGGKDLFPGRSYVGSGDVVESLVPDDRGMMADAADAVAAAQIRLADRLESSTDGDAAFTFSSNVGEIASRIRAAPRPCFDDINALCVLATNISSNISPERQEELGISALKQAALLSIDRTQLKLKELDIDTICVCDNKSLRELEARCVEPARLIEECAARVSAFARAASDAI